MGKVLDRRISNKLLVGGIFAVLIFGLVGSQQAMAGNGADLRINKCVTDLTTGGPGNVNIVECASEGSARSVLLLEEGETGFFRIDIEKNGFSDISNVIVQDKLPAELKVISFSQNGIDYDPDTGEWDVDF